MKKELFIPVIRNILLLYALFTFIKVEAQIIYPALEINSEQKEYINRDFNSVEKYLISKDSFDLEKIYQYNMSYIDNFISSGKLDILKERMFRERTTEGSKIFDTIFQPNDTIALCYHFTKNRIDSVTYLNGITHTTFLYQYFKDSVLIKTKSNNSNIEAIETFQYSNNILQNSTKLNNNKDTTIHQSYFYAWDSLNTYINSANKLQNNITNVYYNDLILEEHSIFYTTGDNILHIEKSISYKCIPNCIATYRYSDGILQFINIRIYDSNNNVKYLFEHTLTSSNYRTYVYITR